MFIYKIHKWFRIGRTIEVECSINFYLIYLESQIKVKYTYEFISYGNCEGISPLILIVNTKIIIHDPITIVSSKKIVFSL